MEISAHKKITPISLITSPLLSHIISNLVQAPDKTYDEIIQALAGGDVLLPKSFLDLTPLTVKPRLRPFELPRVWKTEKSPRPEISICRHCQSRSPKASRGPETTSDCYVYNSIKIRLQKCYSSSPSKI
jgi:hypothetical protein